MCLAEEELPLHLPDRIVSRLTDRLSSEEHSKCGNWTDTHRECNHQMQEAKSRKASCEADSAHVREAHEQSWITYLALIHPTQPTSPHPTPGSGSRIREDGWATGRAETVTLGSHVIRSMYSGKRPLDRHPGPSLLSLFSPSPLDARLLRSG